jgi:SAM-dependent methyltransferase
LTRPSSATGASPVLNEWLETRLERFGRDATVLDLGSGRGYWLDRMIRRGLTPVGVEYRRERAVEYEGDAPVAVGDALRLPFRDASIDLVWSIHVLHHLPDPETALREVRRVLRPDGHLVIAETVEDHPVIRVARSVRPRWDGVPVHARFSGRTFRALVGDSGLEVVDSRQHSLVSWAAWALPRGREAAWLRLSRMERRLPARVNRWGAHLEIVATRRAP